jgi:hypothetical protein
MVQHVVDLEEAVRLARRWVQHCASKGSSRRWAVCTATDGGTIELHQHLVTDSTPPGYLVVDHARRQVKATDCHGQINTWQVNHTPTKQKEEPYPLD